MSVSVSVCLSGFSQGRIPGTRCAFSLCARLAAGLPEAHLLVNRARCCFHSLSSILPLSLRVCVYWYEFVRFTDSTERLKTRYAISTALAISLLPIVCLFVPLILSFILAVDSSNAQQKLFSYLGHYADDVFFRMDPNIT